MPLPSIRDVFPGAPLTPAALCYTKLLSWAQSTFNPTKAALQLVEVPLVHANPKSVTGVDCSHGREQLNECYPGSIVHGPIVSAEEIWLLHVWNVLLQVS